MLDNTTPTPIPATISKQELFQRFLSGSIHFEAVSSLVTRKTQNVQVRDDFFQGDHWAINPTFSGGQEDALQMLEASLAPEEDLSIWIENYEVAARTLKVVEQAWRDLLDMCEINIARDQLIDQLETLGDEIGVDHSELINSAEIVAEYMQDGEDCDISDPTHLATIMHFLGEESPKFERTYGQAAKLALHKLVS